MQTLKVLFLLILSSVLVFSPSQAQSTTLEIGGQAVVYVQDPTGLRVRENAGVSHAAITSLFSGQLIEIIGGPQQADGYVWWNIRTIDGIEGWSVEAVNSLVTLVPLAESSYTTTPLSHFMIPIDSIYNMAFSPDNSLIAVGALYGAGVSIYETETGEFVTNLSSNTPEIIRWSVDGLYLDINDNMASLTQNQYPDSQTVYETTSWELVEDISLLEDIEWTSFPYKIHSLSECLSTGSNRDSMVIINDVGTLTAGIPATFKTSDQTLTLGNGEGGIMWHEDSEVAVIWSKATLSHQETPDNDGNNIIVNGYAEVWNLPTHELLLRAPHGQTDLGSCGNDSKPPLISTDGQYLAVAKGGDQSTRLEIWRLSDTQANDD